MILYETALKDAYIIDIERLEDNRGFLPVPGATRNLQHMD
jgi:hypothetical protein